MTNQFGNENISNQKALNKLSHDHPNRINIHNQQDTTNSGSTQPIKLATRININNQRPVNKLSNCNLAIWQIALKLSGNNLQLFMKNMIQPKHATESQQLTNNTPADIVCTRFKNQIEKTSVVCFRNCSQSPTTRRWLNNLLLVYSLIEEAQ